jgi:hypothetical protein
MLGAKMFALNWTRSDGRNYPRAESDERAMLIRRNTTVWRTPCASLLTAPQRPFDRVLSGWLLSAPRIPD